MKKKNILKNQNGFTLIEIIAVLVLLGILSAVAAPKYFNVAPNAELNAIKAVRAELQARANKYYGLYMLDPDKNATKNEQSLDAWITEANKDDDYYDAGNLIKDTEYISEDFKFSKESGELKIEIVRSKNPIVYGDKYKIEFSIGTENSPAKFKAIRDSKGNIV